ncbi:hypothetical protein PAXRUDRAFT_16952 [Paxillus rubicundulus Ve08.2h10]|uniref:Uncharacterized protein n=1 Tax=Paxillus rubicundulus Ve08.2h10 TaxID=930991 RepID=A0A0D0D3Y0_9AGAM|nr:hypothetical protein PAXRUDRAFT_16952 [Paxillus rubicundulus Ve08.2h10]
MERTIGNLGQEIQQPSKPFANLAQEGMQRCQVNTLLSIIPELNVPPKGLPPGAVDLGGGYALLCKHAKHPTVPDANVAHSITAFLAPGQEMPCIQKWARLLLPNGQIARSVWREALKPPEQLRVSHNVKFLLNGNVHCGEVQYFTQLSIKTWTLQEDQWEFCTVVVLKLYSEPDEKLRKLSSQVVPASKLLKDIRSIVTTIPKMFTLLESDVEEEYFCMVERLGLDISDLGVPYSVYADNNNNDANEVE